MDGRKEGRMTGMNEGRKEGRNLFYLAEYILQNVHRVKQIMSGDSH